MKKAFIYFVSAGFCALILVLPGCGSSSANSSQNPASDKPKTVEQSPAAALNDILAKTSSSTYSLAIVIDNEGLKGGSLQCQAGWVTYTQKGNNYRVDHPTYNPANHGNYDSSEVKVAIYNGARKQKIGLGMLVTGNRMDDTFDEKATTGWISPDSRDITLPKVVWMTLLEAINTSSLSDFDITRNNDTFSLSNKNIQTYVPGDTRYVIECKGPGGLPSKLSKQIDTYGANKGSTTPIVEFTYTNFNNVPDSMFEIPSDTHVYTKYNTGVFGDMYCLTHG